MINIIIDERDNTVIIPYSCAGEEKIIKINNSLDARELILAIKKISLMSGEAICLEVKNIYGLYTEIDRW